MSEPTVVTAPPHLPGQVFPARPEQVREARSFLTRILAGCPAADDAILCLSELASNSVVHSSSRKQGGTFTVRAEIRAGYYLRLEVADDGGPWNGTSHGDRRAHGLDIVRSLAADSGIDGDASTGWLAWARFDWPVTDPPPAASG